VIGRAVRQPAARPVRVREATGWAGRPAWWPRTANPALGVASDLLVGAGRIKDEVVAASFRDGDDPAVIAKVIVTAATDQKPRLRYPAGPTAGRVSLLRRIVPARAVDKAIRKRNRLAGRHPLAVRRWRLD
jgi:hypothetical protein